MIPVDGLVPTADNTRRPITNASVESLAKSLARDGVLQPIVVRPHPSEDGKWEIRAGERRWRAAKLAGLKEIPAIVRPLDDEDARTVTIAENLQRENLHPLEEAAAFQQGLDKGQEPKALAAKLGKSVAFVLRRASLTRLAKVWRDEVLRPESDLGRFSVAHLELISRLPSETQELLAENSFHRVFARGFPTVQELRRIIDDGLRTLVSMPWKLDDETLDPKAGPCTNCPKRSGMQPELFASEDAPSNGKVSKTDRCLDPACFDRKHAAFVLQREATLRREHPDLRLVQIGFDGIGPAAASAFGDRTTRLYSPRFVKNGTAVMQVSGPKAGQLVHVEFDDVHANGRARGGRAGKEGGKPAPMSLEDRKARLRKRRDAFVVAKVLERLRAMTPGTLAETVAAIRKRSDESAKQFDPLSLVLAFGTSTRADRDHDAEVWTRYEQLRADRNGLPVPTALHEVVQVWISRLGGSDTHHVSEQAYDARRICELLGIDAASIQEQAEKEIPTPKSWASLEVRSTGPSLNGSAIPTDTEEPPFDPSPPRAVSLAEKRASRFRGNSKARARRKPPTRRR